jgi:hypothetical protein
MKFAFCSLKIARGEWRRKKETERIYAEDTEGAEFTEKRRKEKDYRRGGKEETQRAQRRKSKGKKRKRRKEKQI